MNVEQKIEFLATTYGRDAYKAVNECPFHPMPWYGGTSVAEAINEDELDREYFDFLVEEISEQTETDIEFWNSLSYCLSSFVIDGNPWKEDEDEDEDEE